MNKTITMFRRVGAVILCLAMMCGVIMNSIVLPSVAAEPENAGTPNTQSEVETFDVKFADLAALVNSTDYDANGLYASTASDTAINEWINARFGVFVNRETSRYKQKEFLGQGSFSVIGFESINGSAFNDNWGGEINLKVSSAGALHHTSTKVGDQQIRKSHALTVKNQYGDYAELANFEAEIIFNKAGNDNVGAVYVSFHEKTPGKMNRNNNDFKVNSGNEAVIVGRVSGTNDGIIVGNAANTNTKTGYTNIGKLDSSADYKLTVKVVGTALTATVTKVADGSVVHTSTKTIAAGSGSLSIGLANCVRNLKTVKVTELDEAGIPVDFGQQRTLQDFSWSLANKGWYGSSKYWTHNGGSSNSYYYNFVNAGNGVLENNETSKAIVAAMNAQFDGVYNREGTVKPSAFGSKVSYEGQPNTFLWYRTAYLNRWLQLTYASLGGHELMRHISSLVPKGHDGERFYFQNFETTFEVRLTNLDTVIAFGFRQNEAGKFTTQWYGMNQQQGMVAFSSAGYNFGAGTQIIGARTNAANAADDMYNKLQNKYAGEKTIVKDSVVEVYVKAVGDQVTLKITDKGTTGNGNTVLVNKTETVMYREPGYFAYGIGRYSSDMGAITLTHLDESGNKISLYERTQVEKDAKNSANATKREFDFKNIPGAPYASNAYTGLGANWANFSSFDERVEEKVLGDVQLIFNDGATRTNRKAVLSGKGTWLLFYNRWLQLASSPATAPTRIGNINAVVPLDDNGIRQAMPDSEVSFDFNIEDSTNTILVGMRQNVPGLFMTGDGELNKNQVLVAITKKTIRVAGGDDISWDKFAIANDAEYTDDENTDVFASPLQTSGGTAVNITVKALGKDIEVVIRSDAGTQLYRGEFTTDYARSGYTAIGISNSKKGNIGAVTLAKLNPTGYYVDYPQTTSIPACDWDTTATRFNQWMSQPTEKLAELYDFSFNGAAESPDAHWGVDANGILNRNSNDLGANATDKFAALTVKKNATEKQTYDFFDAIFQVNLDETKQSTFWVVGGQTDAATVGQVVATSGGTDYYKDRFAVGFAVGGDITFWLGDGEPVVIPGLASGTPTGAYNLRVRVYGDTIEAYVNGTLYAKRTLSANAKTKGMLSFGFAGQEGGIEGVTITRLNKNGATVNYDPVVTEVETVTEPIAVPVHGTIIGRDLPATVKVFIDGEWKDSRVYWDPDSANFNTVGEVYVTGYLEATNDVRTEHFMYVGTHNRQNTVSYSFDSTDELKDFESWFLPTTAPANAPAIHTEGTDNDNWQIDKTNGWLVYKQNSLYTSKTDNFLSEEGVTFPTHNNYVYKDAVNTNPVWAANFGVLVLKTQKYKNFVLDIDMKTEGRWGFVGFGAQDYADALSVFSSQEKGGYSFHIEHGSEVNNRSRSTAKLRGFVPGDAENPAVAKSLKSASFADYIYKGFNHIKIVVSDGVATLYVNHSGTPVLSYALDNYQGGYIYLALNQAGNAYNNLQITDLDAGKIVATKIVSGNEDLTVDREKGEEFNDPQREIVVADAKGYEYSICTNWTSSDYRSDIEGTFTFTLDATQTWHNIDISALAGAQYKLENKIGMAYNTDNTHKYYFESKNELNDFESWYLLTTNGTDIPAIHTEGTADDNWLIKQGTLAYQKNSLYANTTQLAEGITYNNYLYQDERNFSAYASNHAIAVLKSRTYKNFILDVDVYSGGRWAPIGFGLEGYDNPLGVHAVHKKGGYTFNIEHGDPTSTAKVWTYVEGKDGEAGESKYVTSGGFNGYKNTVANHIRIVVVDGVASLYVNKSGTPALTYELPASYNGGYIYLSLNEEAKYYDNLQIIDLDAGSIKVQELISGAEDKTVNRENGEEFKDANRTLKVKDDKGYTYEVPAQFNNADYRSDLEGEFTFTIDATQTISGIDISVLAGTTYKLTNQIGKAYNRNNTRKYYFESQKELDDFESWYLPSTNGTNIPAIHTEGTADDNWYIKDAALAYKTNSMNVSNSKLAEGVTFPQYNNHRYQDERTYAGYASNHAIAVLKAQKYTNFILDVDVKASGYWTPIGFGLENYTNPVGVHAIHEKGGYSFHVEQGDPYSTAKLWGYVAGADGAAGSSKTMKSGRVDGFSSGKVNHIRIVVSDGVAMLYVNNNGVPAITYQLPDTYKGGYIYLSLNKTSAYYDNLQITDLDKEKIVIDGSSVKISDVTINREKGEELNLKYQLSAKDKDGYKYNIAVDWNNLKKDYRSWQEGEYVFTLTAPANPWHNVDISGVEGKEMKVMNNIGEEHDQATSRKYYFDHANDLLDFYTQYSQHGYEYVSSESTEDNIIKVYDKDYHSAYDGILVPKDDLFTIANGKVTNSSSATGVGSGWTYMKSARGIASAVLKDVNFYNFKLEFDFNHSGMWYTYGIVGVQDQKWTNFYGKLNLDPEEKKAWDYEDSNGEKKWKETDIGMNFSSDGGLWTYLEQEGYINFAGAVNGGSSMRFTQTSIDGDIKATYDKTKTHHMVLTVIDGLVTVEVDGNGEFYYAALDEAALGGLVGFANHRNGSAIDNFQLTALDGNGDPIAWDKAVDGVDKGWAPAAIPDNYLGWKPQDDFVWGDEFEN